MRMRRSTPFAPVSKSLRTLGLVLVAFAGGAVTSQAVFARSQSTSPYDPLDQLAWVLTLVENHYVDPVQRNKIVEGAIKGMVAELDPHSGYMNPEEYAAFQSDYEGKFGGIGVEVDYRDDKITVLAPMEGSPAARAGIQPGDEILAIDGKLLGGMRFDKIVGLMRGAAGSRVRLTVRRAGVAEPLQLDLTREVIQVASVVGKRLEGDVAFVRLRQFQERTHEELLTVTKKLREESARPLRGVLLDMRDNPGGLVDVAEQVADELLDGGTIYSTRQRGKVIEEAKASSGGALSSLPLVVIVNERSASASEIVAGALQDNRRATVIGAPTFGKGIIQTIHDLPGGAGLALTTARYYTPNGHAVQAQGIVPDVRVEPNQSSEPWGIVHERDYENHVPAEPIGGVPSGAKVARGSVVRASEGDTGPAREVPTNPAKGSDFMLAKGYELLLQKMGAAR